MLERIQGRKNLHHHAHFFNVPSEVAAHILYGFVKSLLLESILKARHNDARSTDNNTSFRRAFPQPC